MTSVHVWQDSPDHGCDDNPSFKWYSYRDNGSGHIRQIFGPFNTRREAEERASAE